MVAKDTDELQENEKKQKKNKEAHLEEVYCAKTMDLNACSLC